MPSRYLVETRRPGRSDPASTLPQWRAAGLQWVFVTVRLADLLADPTLGLRLLVGDPAAPVTWAHSSDLLDPTPFLEPDNLLLTTGTQFQEAAPAQDFARYAERLHARGVPTVGFGTEVVRSGTPAQLVDACAASGVAVVEVPYRTPFIAIARKVADELATAAHARDAWTLQAQHALSLAAISPARIGGVLDELARQLSAGVVLLDAHGEPLSRHGRAIGDATLDTVAGDARRLLRRRLRTGASLQIDRQVVFLQTLGRRHELRGALAVALPTRPDGAATAVITSAVALAEFALHDASRQHEATMIFHAQLLRLVLAGHPGDALSVLAAAGRPLPPRGLRVLITRVGPGVGADLQHKVDLGSGREGALVARWEESVIVIAAGPAIHQVARGLVAEEHSRVAISAECDWSGLAAAVRDTRDALHRSATIEIVEVSPPDLLSLLPADKTAELAQRRLGPLLADPDGAVLLAALTGWLRHHGAWEPAAREQGVHRHTLKHQVQRAARLIGFDLDRFAARAELWILLENLRSPVHERWRRSRPGSRTVSTHPGE